MTYTKARQWLGISGILTIVIISFLAVTFNVTALLPSQPAPFSTELGAFIVVILLYIGIQFPFDMFGGYILPKEYGRSEQSFLKFLLAWLRGIAAQSLVYLITGILLVQAGRAGGFIFYMVMVIFMMFLLIVAQPYLARLAAGMGSAIIDYEPFNKYLTKWGFDKPPSITAFDAPDPMFTGGITGIPGLVEQIILPQKWVDEMPKEMAATEMARRVGVTRGTNRLFGLLGAIIWNYVGLAVSGVLLGRGIDNVADVVAISLVFTLWSALGLLVLPALNRLGVYEADWYLTTLGLTKRKIMNGVTAVDEMQEDEPVEVDSWMALLYSVPTPTTREARLNIAKQDRPRGAWDISATAHYLSWSGMSFLPRMQPANIGRPGLWVLFPSD